MSLINIIGTPGEKMLLILSLVYFHSARFPFIQWKLRAVGNSGNRGPQRPSETLHRVSPQELSRSIHVFVLGSSVHSLANFVLLHPIRVVFFRCILATKKLPVFWVNVFTTARCPNRSWLTCTTAHYRKSNHEHIVVRCLLRQFRSQFNIRARIHPKH